MYLSGWIVVVILVAVIVIALWIHGVGARQNWKLITSMTRMWRLRRESDTVIVVLPGAFNNATAYTAQIRMALLEYGDVIIVDYDVTHFDSRYVVSCVYDRLAKSQRYENLVLLGASMGGKLALVIIRYDQSHSRLYTDRTRFIGCDVPLNAKHIHFAARVAKYVHVGPLFNAVFAFVPKVMFNVMAKDKRADNTDMDVLENHVAAMRRFKPSSMVDQLSYITSDCKFRPDEFRNVRAAFLVSADDGVIKSDEALEACKTLFPNAWSKIIPSGMHATFVEHYDEWVAGLDWAFQQVDIPRRSHSRS